MSIRMYLVSYLHPGRSTNYTYIGQRFRLNLKNLLRKDEKEQASSHPPKTPLSRRMQLIRHPKKHPSTVNVNAVPNQIPLL
jgi:hypothetical protein